MSVSQKISQSRIDKEVSKRRAFAIIAHPDAGKTTLSEKLLLYGGAIHLAGHVRARKNRRNTRSDWMKMEQERGISITSAALQFQYKDFQLNLLDTPGHEDFSEDTYRTLMAVDVAVMLLDAGSGVEAQTIKLFKVCKERKIPIITFLNKMDMPAKDPFTLIDEIDKVLGITACPMVWPLGSGRDFKGIYDFETKQVHWYQEASSGAKPVLEEMVGFEDEKIKESMDPDIYKNFIEGASLAQGALPAFDKELFLEGEQSPVFFGSAIKNFGISLFLDRFLELSPEPRPIILKDKSILEPKDNRFSGFIFKLQANMNEKHRDRIAFMRITSGVFERGMNGFHNRLKKNIRLSNPVSFFGQERSTIDEAFAGDIIGLSNPGIFSIGDVVSVGVEVSIPEIPRFAPEIFTRIIPTDTSKLKAFRRGIDELGEEGVIQVFKSIDGNPILGAVGKLQFETFQYRLLDEYGATSNLELLSYECSRWFNPKDKSSFSSYEMIVNDLENRPLVLFKSIYRLKAFLDNNPSVKLFEHPFS